MANKRAKSGCSPSDDLSLLMLSHEDVASSVNGPVHIILQEEQQSRTYKPACYADLKKMIDSLQDEIELIMN